MNTKSALSNLRCKMTSKSLNWHYFLRSKNYTLWWKLAMSDRAVRWTCYYWIYNVLHSGVRRILTLHAFHHDRCHARPEKPDELRHFHFFSFLKIFCQFSRQRSKGIHRTSPTSPRGEGIYPPKPPSKKTPKSPPNVFQIQWGGGGGIEPPIPPPPRVRAWYYITSWSIKYVWN